MKGERIILPESLWDIAITKAHQGAHPGMSGINPISPGGRILLPPWETFLNNSKTAQDIKMKFSKFNPTYGGHFAYNDNSH